MGYEGKIREEVFEKREAQLEAVGDDLFVENLTFTPDDRKRDKWIERALGNRANILLTLTKKLYLNIDIPRHGNVMVLNASHGLMLYPLMKKNPEGSSIAQVKSKDQKDVIDHFALDLEEILRPQVYVSTPRDVFSLLEDGIKFSVISGRNILSRLSEDKAILPLISSFLDENGTIALMESIPSLSSRLSDFVSLPSVREKMIDAEREIYSFSNPLTSWGKKELEETVKSEYKEAEIEYVDEKEERSVTKEALESWFINSYSKYGVERDEFFSSLQPGVLQWKNTIALITFKGKKRRSGNELKEIHGKVKGN